MCNSASLKARCGVCAAVDAERRDKSRKNEAARRRYAGRKALGRCTDCNAPSQGAARCESCARRSYERSDYCRGVPVWDPVYTVIELATGACHGPFDSEAEAAVGLVFARLSLDQVEIVCDAPCHGLVHRLGLSGPLRRPGGRQRKRKACSGRAPGGERETVGVLEIS